MGKMVMLAALTAELMGCSNRNDEPCATPGYIYDSSTDKRSEVFNLKTKKFSIQSRINADTNDTSSEFSAPIVTCEDNSYWCIRGPLSLVIPKDDATFGAGKWVHEGISCEATPRPGAHTANVTCKSSSNSIVTHVEIMRDRGIVSYRRDGVDDDATFDIRGQCGLFAK